MNAYGYLRLSRSDEDSRSLDTQRAAILEYAGSRKLKIVEWFVDEHVTGTKPLSKRPSGKRMDKALLAGEAKAVIAWKLDRLFRNAEDALTTKRQWDAVDVAVHILDFNGSALDTTTSAGKFTFTMLTGVAEFEANRITERIRESKAYRAKNGLVVARERYGTRHVKGRVVEDELEAKALDEIQKLRAAGLNLSEIARRLTQTGVKSKRGGAWHPYTVSRLLAREGVATVKSEDR